MAANVESMFYVRETPWHGLGTMVMQAPDSTNALRMAGLDWQVLQDTLGHKDFSTTMDIYTDVTRELKQREFGNLQEKMKERKSKKKKEEGDGEADVE